jgi:regulator of cell morphogenesis and NO signaling
MTLTDPHRAQPTPPRATEPAPAGGPAAAALDALATMPLDELTTYVVDRHHTYTRQALERLEPMAEEVLRVHGEGHPELREIVGLVTLLARDLGTHLHKEEQVLFPYLQALGRARQEGRPAPRPFFGTAANPIRMMELEHDRDGQILARLAELTGGYTVPPGSDDSSFRAFYEGLAALEQDLHEHVHVESQLLFPMAVAEEQRR